MPDKKKLKRIVPLLVLLLLAGGAYWFFRHRQQDQDGILRLYGNVDIREVDLTFNNSEHIDSLLVEEGDRVRRGQLLATLHSERLQASVDAAEATVASQQAALARLQAGSRPEEIRKAQADVRAAQARLTNADSTYRRTLSLEAAKAASQQAVDDARAALDAARADLKVSQESLELAQLGPRAEDIEEAQARLKAEQARLELAREVLKDASLFAPADGVIRNRLLEPGDMATPQKPVLTLALNNPVWVRVYVPETSLGQVATGLSATVSTDSYPGKRYTGWVGFISPTAEFTPKNVETPELRTRLVYQARVFVCNPEDELRLGMPATVDLDLTRPPADQRQGMPDCAG
jgi:multidrug resistance efflux pump